MPGVTNSITGASTPLMRVSSKDRVMRDEGAVTADIRLTPSAATIAGGAGYIFGAMDDDACGVYRVSWQAAASATAEPLGASNYAEFEVYENTAGVYVAKINQVTDAAGVVTAGDHEVMDAATALVNAQAQLGTNGDIEFGVADATTVTNSANVTAGFPVAVGDLYLFDGSAASTRVFSVKRMTKTKFN